MKKGLGKKVKVALTKKRKLSDLKKLEEKVIEKIKNRKKDPKKKQKVLKIWDQAVQGSFFYSMQKTAIFLKKRRKKKQ